MQNSHGFSSLPYFQSPTGVHVFANRITSYPLILKELSKKIASSPASFCDLVTVAPLFIFSIESKGISDTLLYFNEVIYVLGFGRIC